MFFSDKDLKKVPNSKRSAGSSATANTKTAPSKQPASTAPSLLPTNSAAAIDVVERARLEREQRQLMREKLVHVIKIQAYCRGWKVRASLFRNMRAELESKLQGVEKVAAAVKAKANIDFSPPTDITMSLIPQLLFLRHRTTDDLIRFVKFVKLMVNPSLSQDDASKNLISNFVLPKHSQAMVTLLDLAFNALLVSAASKKEASFYEPALAFICLLNGADSSGRPIAYNTAVKNHFTTARAMVLRNGFLAKVRHLLTGCGGSLMKATVNDDMLSRSPDFDRIQVTNCSSIASRCVRLCMFLTEEGVDNEVDVRLANFTREVLGTPHVTCLITPATTAALATWPLLGPLLLQLLDKLNNNTLALPPLNHEVIQSGQVLFGNIASLAPKLPILPTLTKMTDGSRSGQTKPSASSSAVFDSVNGHGGEYFYYTDSVVQTYLLTTTALIAKYPIPGVFQGKSGVMWAKDGTSMTASAIPIALHAQALCLLKPDYLRALYSRILLPVRVDLANYEMDSDRQAIQQALTKTGLQLAQDVIKQEQESSVWFTSKWASKLVTKVTKSIGLKSGGSSEVISTNGSNSGNTESGYSALSTEMEEHTVTLPDSEFDLNPELVACLSSQWALLLTQAAGSPIHSAPWRALSTLTYATNSLDRLWAALLSMPALHAPVTKSSIFSPSSSSRNQAHQSSMKASGLTTKPATTSTFLSIFTSPWGGSATATRVVTKDSFVVSDGTTKISAVSTDSKVVDNQKQLESLASNMQLDSQLVPEGPFAVMMVLVCLLRTHLIALDDSELYTQEKPLPLHQLVRVIRVLKLLLYRAIRLDPDRVTEAPQAGLSSSDVKWNSAGHVLPQFQHAALRTVSLVLSDLYSRWARKPFYNVSLWQVDQMDNAASLKTHLKAKSPFALALVKVIPWAISFHDRMILVRDLLDDEKLEIQGAAFESLNPFAQPQHPRSKGTVISVHRARVIEDGMKGFDKVANSIKDRIVIRYVNDFGEEEKGIDSGGLFKDFLTDLSARVFNPSYGLFSMTQNRALYPNPGAIALYGEHETERLYTFLGRVLGKAIFENITVQPEFAHFFLSFLHGRYNYLQMVNDLASLDPEIHKNLMFLKTYEGDIADLCLTFSVTDDTLGVHKEIELFPGGSRIGVTSENKLRYINAVAKYYLYDRLKLQASAFFNGLRQVVSVEHLSVFCAPELQVIISGATTGVLLSDMKAHTQYGGGYSSMSEVVKRFWAIMEEFSDQDRAALLKFVTSCERPPSLGFAALQPPFTIQRVECPDDSRLPTASTCFNVLKLPAYSSQSVLKEKLLTAIRSGAGFDLS